jgi:hypothetical protein
MGRSAEQGRLRLVFALDAAEFWPTFSEVARAKGWR